MKHLTWILTFWKQFEHHILAFTVLQGNTKLYAKYIHVIFGDQFYRRDMSLICWDMLSF